MAQTTEFDIVMEQIGFGRVQLFATVTNGLLQMMTVVETMGMGIIGPAAVCDLHMNSVQLSSVMAASFMGIICSSYFWGYIADKMGRRWTLIVTILLTNLCSIISMFMVTHMNFFFMRFLTGLFVAGPSSVAVTYLSEFCSRTSMSRVITYMYMFTGFGMVGMPALANLMLATDSMDFEVPITSELSVVPWRAFGWLILLPGPLAFLLLWAMPQSPKFLFMVGKVQEGMKVMEWVCKKNTGKSLSEEQVDLLEKYSAKSYSRELHTRHLIRTMLTDVTPLFRKPYVVFYVCSCVVMFSLGLVTHGMGIWYTVMRNRVNMRMRDRKGLSFCRILVDIDYAFTREDEEQDVPQVCNDNFAGFNDSIMLGLIFILLCKCSWALLFFTPRKLLFIISLLLGAFCGIFFVLLSNRTYQLITMIFFITIPGVLVSLLGSSLLEFVHTRFRAKAMCVSLMWCRMGAVIGSNIIGRYIDEYCELTISIFAISLLICAIIEMFLPL